MEQYKILVKEDGKEGQPYPLADRCNKVVREFRKLQVDTTYYTIEERFNLIKEMRWEEEWVAKEEKEKDDEGKETGQLEFELKLPSLNKDDFLLRAAVVLFPDADVEGNLDYVDHEVAIKALEDFTARTDRKSQKLSALFS